MAAERGKFAVVSSATTSRGQARPRPPAPTDRRAPSGQADRAVGAEPPTPTRRSVRTCVGHATYVPTSTLASGGGRGTRRERLRCPSRRRIPRDRRQAGVTSVGPQRSTTPGQQVDLLSSAATCRPQPSANSDLAGPVERNLHRDLPCAWHHAGSKGESVCSLGRCRDLAAPLRDVAGDRADHERHQRPAHQDRERERHGVAGVVSTCQEEDVLRLAGPRDEHILRRCCRPPGWSTTNCTDRAPARPR